MDNIDKFLNQSKRPRTEYIRYDRSRNSNDYVNFCKFTERERNCRQPKSRKGCLGCNYEKQQNQRLYFDYEYRIMETVNRFRDNFQLCKISPHPDRRIDGYFQWVYAGIDINYHWLIFMKIYPLFQSMLRCQYNIMHTCVEISKICEEKVDMCKYFIKNVPPFPREHEQTCLMILLD